jgi:hypothetical protein
MCAGVIAAHAKFLRSTEEAMLRMALAIAMVLSSVAGAAAACPRGQKALGSICVAACPAGYDDQGAACVFRRTGGTGGGV